MSNKLLHPLICRNGLRRLTTAFYRCGNRPGEATPLAEVAQLAVPGINPGVLITCPHTPQLPPV